MESKRIIMILVYVECLLKAMSGCLQLRGENWRRLVFYSMMMASKVRGDLSMTNADFSKIWRELSLTQINELEPVCPPRPTPSSTSTCGLVNLPLIVSLFVRTRMQAPFSTSRARKSRTSSGALCWSVRAPLSLLST
ncbi:hypothetical protein V7S43_005008 [Phytophthora oleae]|uniref:Uncharacterized protein n=1 Tax=Phytophthora oleae TaxID=2107226 RepID=A0ABD3FSA7_9STRA